VSRRIKKDPKSQCTSETCQIKFCDCSEARLLRLVEVPPVDGSRVVGVGFDRCQGAQP
jgi:hypothetical protein